ncbi:hypothetical protein AVEN_195790-1 [Araneus ventricosus]|uniref:Uncharacterized protein n=1 Tax=Araneus ventricosus TaxID=182803 RepID=A0A4Y2JEF6_ARAVE|nr:hypothetical protein AVEN_195790-1 [Araneus ventricosus]
MILSETDEALSENFHQKGSERTSRAQNAHHVQEMFTLNRGNSTSQASLKLDLQIREYGRFCITAFISMSAKFMDSRKIDKSCRFPWSRYILALIESYKN